jgi:hypothetical protein
MKQVLASVAARPKRAVRIQRTGDEWDPSHYKHAYALIRGFDDRSGARKYGCCFQMYLMPVKMMPFRVSKISYR